MKEAKATDVFLLLLLGAIWGSSFFNIKIATYSYEPYTLALIRVILATVTMLAVSFIYKINEIIESSDPDLLLQKLYFITRIFDSINIILIVFSKLNLSGINFWPTYIWLCWH